MMGSFLSPDFVTEGRNLVLSGKAGRGKTHLATAIAFKAIQNGFTALFTTCAALVDDLSSVATNRRGFREGLLRYTSPDVLVVDEVGYLTYSHDAANVLFHVVNERHLKKKSMHFTTNKPFSSWGAVLHDEDLAQAILDRVFERGRHIKLDGPSIRTLHLDGVLPTEENQQARVSGMPGPEFPEPTATAAGVVAPETDLCHAVDDAITASRGTREQLAAPSSDPSADTRRRHSALEGASRTVAGARLALLDTTALIRGTRDRLWRDQREERHLRLAWGEHHRHIDEQRRGRVVQRIPRCATRATARTTSSSATRSCLRS